jgi:hypothetical protein
LGQPKERSEKKNVFVEKYDEIRSFDGSFLMISPNLHDIWVMFFLNLSQELKLVLLLYFGTLGDGYSL